MTPCPRRRRSCAQEACEGRGGDYDAWGDAAAARGDRCRRALQELRRSPAGSGGRVVPECPGGVFERFERAGPLWGEERWVPRLSSRCDVSSDGECGVRGLGR